MKLSKQQEKLHEQVMSLVRSDKVLTEDERLFILENYQESKGQLNALSGAFFTPAGLARDAAIEVIGDVVVDLCAGIGMLSFACEHPGRRLICVERCNEYLEVGKRVLPHAEWIHSDVFSVGYDALGHVDCVISNPPFGSIKGGNFTGRYSGSEFEYKVIELASRIAPYGVFIIPQNSAPFRLSGVRCFENSQSNKHAKFFEQTGIELSPGCGADTSIYREEWHGVSPVCEIVCCEFDQEQALQGELL